MSREIKFRAWDSEENKWYAPTHEAYKGDLFELLVSFKGDLAAHTMSGLDHESLWPNRYILMQYTGLKDKNGVEIYEGDVVTPFNYRRAIRGKEWEGFKAVVDYYKSMFRLTPNEALIQQSHPLHESLILGQAANNQYVVIGNIYENPELK